MDSHVNHLPATWPRVMIFLSFIIVIILGYGWSTFDVPNARLPAPGSRRNNESHHEGEEKTPKYEIGRFMERKRKGPSKLLPV